MENFNDQLKFIKEHEEQIIPVTENKELAWRIGQHDGVSDFLAPNQERVEKILELGQIYLCE